ncbi:hypothetical protein MMC2321_02913 [Chitinophaga sp. MM2321]
MELPDGEDSTYRGTLIKNIIEVEQWVSIQKLKN